MSTCIQYAYKFSDEFTIDSYQKAIKFLSEMREKYQEYLIEHIPKDYKLDLSNVEYPMSYLVNRIKKDMRASYRGALLSIELDASIVCWANSIVFVFFPNNKTTIQFMNEYLKDYEDWSFQDQTDDDFERYEKLGIGDFWYDFLDHNSSIFRESCAVYTIFDEDDVFDVVYHITEHME